MTVDFTPAPRVTEWQDRIRGFVDEVVIPREQAVFAEGLTDDVSVATSSRPRASAGIWAPTAQVEFGGGGFRIDEFALLLEEAGRSLLGPLAINCAAPDEGNIHMLERDRDARAAEALPATTRRGRGPFVVRDDRTASGRGLRPGRAAHDGPQGGRWLGHLRPKHLITGADGSAFTIVMARTRESGGARRCCWSTPRTPECASSDTCTPSTG